MKHSCRIWSASAIALILLGACATAATSTPAPGSAPNVAAPKAAEAKAKKAPKIVPKGLNSTGLPDSFPSTYQPIAGPPTAIIGATILTAAGQEIADGTIVFADGKILAVGTNVTIPEGARRIDGRGKFVTPGIIDIHSHLGVYPSPGVAANSDGNEATDPNTAEVWSEHSIWPQDPGFHRAREGGVIPTAL